MFPPKVRAEFPAWLRARAARDPAAEPVCFLQGPPGCGKRTLVYAAAAAAGLDVVEPSGLELDDIVQAFTSSCLVSTLQTALAGTAMPPRVWLCAGFDGLLSSADACDKSATPAGIRALQHMCVTGGVGLPPIVFTTNAPCWQWKSQPKLRVRVFRCLAANFEFRANRMDVQAGLERLMRATRAHGDAAMFAQHFTGDWRQSQLSIAWSVDAVGTARKDASMLDAFDSAKCIMQASRALLRARTSCVAMDMMAEAAAQVPLLLPLLHRNCVAKADADDLTAVVRVAELWSLADELLATFPASPLHDVAYAMLGIVVGQGSAAARVVAGEFLDMPAEHERVPHVLRKARATDIRQSADDAFLAALKANPSAARRYGVQELLDSQMELLGQPCLLDVNNAPLDLYARACENLLLLGTTATPWLLPPSARLKKSLSQCLYSRSGALKRLQSR